MGFSWKKEGRSFVGYDPRRPRYSAVISVLHVYHWTLSIDERRLAQGDAVSLAGAQAACEAAIAAQESERRKP